MPLRSWKIRITDIIDAIENVLKYTEGMAFENFIVDQKTIDAVIRNFIIIGEAAVHVPEDFIELHTDIPW